jgi:hypothetical protein
MKTVQEQVERLLCGLSPLATNRFMRWMLVDPEHGVIRFATDEERPAIASVAALHDLAINCCVVPDKQKWAAAWDAAWAAACAANVPAARDAARAAARAAGGPAAWYAAWYAAWDAQLAKLNEIIAAEQQVAA